MDEKSLDSLRDLMLDALKRGIMSMNNIKNSPVDERGRQSRPALGIIAMKKAMCSDVMHISREARVRILVAIARAVGIDAIGTHSNGCLVNITDWNDEITKTVFDVIQFATK